MKKWFFGLIALLVAAMVFMGCPPDGGDDDPVYTVTVTPASIGMAPGASRDFDAVLKKDGVAKSGATTWTVTAGTATKHGGTTIEEGHLSLDSAQATGTLIVTASISFDGSDHTGTATVTVLSAEDVETALTAITSAIDAATLLTALKAPAAGINPALVVDANSAAYWTSKTSIDSALSSGSTNEKISNLEDTLIGINGTVLMNAVNSAANASAVQALVTEAAFKSIDADELRTMYSGLSSTGKTTVATTIYNGGAGYSVAETLLEMVYNAIYAQYMAEIALQLKSSLDAVLGTNPTLAQINTFLAKCAEIGAPQLTVTQSQLPTVQSALTAAKTTDTDIMAYLAAGSGATADQTTSAVGVVYGIIGGIIGQIVNP
jgi:phage tail protein X